MKTRHIFRMLAALMVAIGMQGCSSNEDATLIPTLKDRYLHVDGHETAYNVSYKADPETYEIHVESNTLWKVVANSTGGWLSVDKTSGKGNESFSISVRDNMLEPRTGSVTVYMVDAQGEALPATVAGSSLIITVVQDASNVRLSPSLLAPFPASDNERQLFEVISNVSWTLSVAYEGENPTEFITITPDGGTMRANGDGTFSGENGATFYASIADNRTATDRKAYLNLRSNMGTYSVELTQSKAEYTFDVSPLGNQIVAAKGGSIEFGVLSISDWKVASSEDLSGGGWITFSRLEGTASDSRVTTVATIAPNDSATERTAQIKFTSQYGTLSVDIIQRAFDITYNVSRTDAVGVVSEKGESLYIEIDSRFAWQASASSWISLSKTSGTESRSAQTIEAYVRENLTNESRPGVITLTPLPTEFEGVVTLNPADLGVQPINLGITQFGGREPAISIPWLSDSYSQTTATVNFNFYSPFYDIVEAGLEWSREDGTAPDKMTVKPSDSKDCTVTFDLTGLDPATRYIARGYVVDENGTTKYGEWSYPFSTTGRYPDSGDNPTPSK